MTEITAEYIMAITSDNLNDLDKEMMFAVIATFEGVPKPHHKTGAANLRKIINGRLNLGFIEEASKLELTTGSARKGKDEQMYNVVIQKPADEMKSKNSMHAIGVNGFIRWLVYGKKYQVPRSVIGVLENAVTFEYLENPEKNSDPNLVVPDFIKQERPRISFSSSPV